jgi:hypothetical protein
MVAKNEENSKRKAVVIKMDSFGKIGDLIKPSVFELNMDKIGENFQIKKIGIEGLD